MLSREREEEDRNGGVREAKSQSKAEPVEMPTLHSGSGQGETMSGRDKNAGGAMEDHIPAGPNFSGDPWPQGKELPPLGLHPCFLYSESQHGAPQGVLCHLSPLTSGAWKALESENTASVSK